MKADPVLNKVSRLARSRGFEKAIRILNAEENRYSGSFKYYYLYAVICLYSGDFGGALSWFRLARQIKLKDPFTMLGLAVLYLRRGDTSQAVDYYLDIQEIDSKNKTAKKALAVIRKYSQPDSLSGWLASDKIKKLYPPIPSPAFTPNRFIGVFLAVTAAALLVFGILVKFRLLPSVFRNRERPSAEFTLSVPERGAPVELGGSYRYILTRDQAVGTYDKALSLFTAYRDEAAKINLNRILESNASDGLKNKARLMLSYTEIPGFDNFKRSDNVSFTDVKKEPVLYRDVYVIWKGMATNVEVTEERTVFDFLVGYDTRKTLEGIVSVVFDGPVALNSERPLEVLGKIVLSDSTSEKIRLDGEAIHQSGRLDRVE
ncbi:MAG: tetratricopeptide repeat protein [Treponema sp.]|jgi:tetratricopeptide (TPR) repeat protein|nr:tetratricopeptide repeat protein [Treponema sp.]